MAKDFILFIFLVSLVANCSNAIDETLDVSQKALEREELQHEIIMENVTNMKTPGYRESNANIQGDGDIRVQKYNNFTQGHFIHTGKALDIAIEGKGFFTVQKNNEVFYTRDGRFYTDKEKMLRTFSGNFLVVGESGPIYYDDSNGELLITQTGKVMQDGVVLDRLLIAEFADVDDIKAVNGAFYQFKRELGKFPEYMENYSLKIGYVEGSNVNLSKQLVRLPNVQKLYDANSAVIKARLKAISGGLEIGKVQ